MPRRYRVPALWLLALLVCGLLVARTPVVTDLTLFLPETDGSAALLAELREGPASRLLLIALQGAPAPELAQISRRLAERLRRNDRFTRVANGSGAGLLEADGRRRLFEQRYLLSPEVRAERFTTEGLHRALQARMRELASPFGAFEKRLLPADPTGEWLALLRHWQPASQPRRHHGVWFSRDGGRALMLAETRTAGFELDAQAQAIAAIEAAFDAVKTADAELLLSGTGVFATRSRAMIRAETEALSLAATGLVVLLLLASYRSPRLVVLGMLPLVTGVLAAAAAVGLVFGSLYGITLAFGVTLLGVAIDYPVHVFSHLNARETVAASVARIWPTLRLGALTTVIGYLAMVTTEFGGLAQLGVFAVVGLLSAAATTRWLLPALLPTVWSPRHGAGDWLTPLLRPHPVFALVLVIPGLLAPLVWLSAPAIWEDDLAALSPVPAGAVALDRQLRTALGAPEAGQLVVVIGADPQTALRHSEAVGERLQALIEQGKLAGFEAAFRYLPSRRTQRQRQAALLPPEVLAQRLDDVQADFAFRPDLFEPFLAAVEAARTDPLLGLQDVADTALGTRVSSLLFPGGGRWLALMPLVQVSDPAAISATLADLAGARYLDLRVAANRMVVAFRDAALVRLAWGGSLIVVVLALALRSPRRVLAVLVPVALAVTIDVAVLVGLGERLSLFHLVSLLLVLGIGLDYSLFFSRGDADPAVRRRTLHAVLIGAGSTMAVFGILALSQLPVLNAIGQTVAIGVCASFLLALTVAQQVAKPAPRPET